MIMNNTILALEVLYKITAGFLFNWEALFILCVFGLGLGGLYLYNKAENLY